MTKNRSQQLRQEINKAKKRLKKLHENVAKAQLELEQTLANIEKHERTLEKMKNFKVQVTEHATLRFIERIMCINLEEVKQIIAPEEITKIIKEGGDGKYTVANEMPGFGRHVITVKDGAVVTVTN